MELNQLKTFLQVVRDGGFSRAAQALHLTQPAVSQQIRALETELGVALLWRHGREVQPTPAGKVLQVYAENVLTVIARTETALAEFKEERRGRLLLGAGNTTITFRLPPLLRAFRLQEPRVEVIVRAGNSLDLLALLAQGQLDLALVTSPPKERQFLVEPLFHDEIILILPCHHPLADAGEIAAADLAGLSSILFARGSGFRQFLDQACAQAGYRPEVVMELDSIEGIKQLVQTGLGLSFLPRIAVAKELAEGSLGTAVVRGLVPAHRTTYVAYRREQFQAAPLKAFLDLLAKTAINPRIK